MGKIIRDVQICALHNGKRGHCLRVSALLDTGAQHTTMDRSLAEELEADVIKEAYGVEFGDGSETVADATNVELRLIAPRCEPWRTPAALVIDPKHPRRNGIRLLLGQDYLQERNVQLNFKKKPGADKARCVRT